MIAGAELTDHLLIRNNVCVGDGIANTTLPITDRFTKDHLQLRNSTCAGDGIASTVLPFTDRSPAQTTLTSLETFQAGLTITSQKAKTGPRKTKAQKKTSPKTDPKQNTPPDTRCWLGTCLEGTKWSPENERSFNVILPDVLGRTRGAPDPGTRPASAA